MGVRGKGFAALDFVSASIFEPPVVVAVLDDVAVMHDAIEQSSGHLGVRF
jgi:hypothetical protein